MIIKLKSLINIDINLHNQYNLLELLHLLHFISKILFIFIFLNINKNYNFEKIFTLFKNSQ
jgi:hypothetical protein